MMPEQDFQAVLFDLDGTVADTAPDLIGALNCVRSDEGLPALPVKQLRAYASQGPRRLLREGMGIQHEQPDYPVWEERFLAHYANRLCAETRLFPGILELLDALDARGLLWGIVTNKRQRYTGPLLEALGLGSRAACIVCGDTTEHPKPAPDPILHACTSINVRPERCVFVGDDVRDIQAGQAAQTATLAAAWGYLGSETDIGAWGANGVVGAPGDIVSWLG